MKRLNLFFSLLMLLVIGVSCNDEFDTPPIITPKASLTPNMTILDFKTKYWQDGRNFIDTCKEDIVIHGWVVSDDTEGNIYKYIYIQDETAGMGISIDASGLSTTYRRGQEVVLNMKDFWMGKYNGQYLIGKPEWYAAQSAWEAGRLTLDEFKLHAELNGLPTPDAEQAQPLETKISDFQGKSDKDTQLKYQGRLIKLKNVKWEAADGEAPYSNADKSTERNIVDEENNTLIAVNSMYANFRTEALPLGTGDITGVLYLTGDSKWQLLLRDTNDCQRFSNSTKGTMKDPYTVEEAIEAQNTDVKGWVEGYVAGAVAPEVTSVSGNNDIEWTAPTVLDNTLIIAPSPDVKDYSKCLVVELPNGSAFRTKASLKNYPELLGTKILVYGKLATVMGMSGIAGNTGSESEFSLSIATGGVTELNEDFETAVPPAGWTQGQMKGTKAWYQATFSNTETGITEKYAAMTGYKGTAPFDSWLITPALDIKNAGNKNLSFDSQVNGYGSTTTKFEVYLMSTDNPSTATLVQLNPTIATAPSSGYSGWVNSGQIDLSAYEGTYHIGFRYVATTDANYATWCVDNVKFGGAAPLSTIDDFETMNGGTAIAGIQTQLASTNGWLASNCSLLDGNSTNNGSSNPHFMFIGNKIDGAAYKGFAFAPCLDGNTTAVGTLASPTLNNGIKTLKFSYGAAYSNSKFSFRIDVLNNAGPVWTKTVTNNAVEKYKEYTFEEEVNVSGACQIVFTNLCPSGKASKNQDRVAIWNVFWTE